MIFRKPKIQVLKVHPEVRDVVEESHYYGGLMQNSATKKKTVKNCSYTIVLFTKNGELMTREFNGDWNLNDIKKWEQR